MILIFFGKKELSKQEMSPTNESSSISGKTSDPDPKTSSFEVLDNIDRDQYHSTLFDSKTKLSSIIDQLNQCQGQMDRLMIVLRDHPQAVRLIKDPPKTLIIFCLFKDPTLIEHYLYDEELKIIATSIRPSLVKTMEDPSLILQQIAISHWAGLSGLKNPNRELVKAELTKNGYNIIHLDNPDAELQMIASETRPETVLQLDRIDPEVQKALIIKNRDYFDKIKNPDPEVIDLYEELYVNKRPDLRDIVRMRCYDIQVPISSYLSKKPHLWKHVINEFIIAHPTCDWSKNYQKKDKTDYKSIILTVRLF